MDQQEQHQAAITAAFLMEGLHDAGYERVIKAYRNRGGAIELVSAVMEWVPAIDALCAAAEIIVQEYPGVFEYEVTSTLGQWLGTCIIETGDLPPRDRVMHELAGLVFEFFMAEKGSNAALHRALDKATSLLYSAQSGA